MKRIERIKEHGGWLERYQHLSTACSCEMTFSIYLPPQAVNGPVPTLYWLSGLTCTDDNFRVKAGAQRYAAALGVAIVMPDTSPRGENIPDMLEHYDLGKGAGFYLNATQPPWAEHYQMYSYITEELPALVEGSFPLQPGVRSISGHSMGGHGALICALKNPGSYRSVSAFAPICNPINSGWGVKCFTAYLGTESASWQTYDATCLIQAGAELIPILIDQGTGDEFLADQLHPQNLEAACAKQAFPLTVRMRPNYDHSYHFIATFIGEHMEYHAKYLLLKRQ